MTATATKTSTVADLRERLVAVIADLPAAQERVVAARSDLGAALLEDGAEARTAAAQAAMSAANLAVQRLEVGAEALTEALAEAEAAEAAAARAVLVRQHNAALAQADGLIREWLEAAAALAPIGVDLRTALDRANSLSYTITPPAPGREDRRGRPQMVWSLLREVVTGGIPGAHGSSFSSTRGADAAEKLRTFTSRFTMPED